MEKSLIGAPDNASRRELNVAVRQELEATGAENPRLRNQSSLVGHAGNEDGSRIVSTTQDGEIALDEDDDRSRKLQQHPCGDRRAAQSRPVCRCSQYQFDHGRPYIGTLGDGS
jgi:hypothetical protein